MGRDPGGDGLARALPPQGLSESFQSGVTGTFCGGDRAGTSEAGLDHTFEGYSGNGE